MASSRLARYLEANANRICQRYAARLRAVSAAAALEHSQVINHLEELLHELADLLRETKGGDSSTSVSARAHGGQRFQLGYDARALVQEYGELFALMFEMLMEDGEAVSPWEVHVLAGHLLHAAAESVARYGEARDRQLEEHAARHLSFLAHELRNPLASIRLSLHLLMEKGALTPSRPLAAIERGLASMSRLIDETLVDVRLRGMTVVDPAHVEVVPLIDELLQESDAERETKALTFRVEATPPLALWGDRRLLHSALSNLLRNAIKFSRPGGEVVLRARTAESRLLVEVEDSCGGLPPGAIAKIFDPFVQAGKDRSGFGIGLAITKQVALAHHGDVRVHDLPGKGCVFLLDLPVDAAAAGED